jgi:hypothetical protein
MQEQARIAFFRREDVSATAMTIDLLMLPLERCARASALLRHALYTFAPVVCNKRCRIH